MCVSLIGRRLRGVLEEMGRSFFELRPILVAMRLLRRPTGLRRMKSLELKALSQVISQRRLSHSARRAWLWRLQARPPCQRTLGQPRRIRFAPLRRIPQPFLP